MPRVLLVEDDAAIRCAVKDCLTAELGQVTFGETADADQALQALRSSAWDLVLLDLRLPRTNGLVTLGWLRHVRPEVPVVIVTDLPAEPYEEASVRRGAARFVPAAQASARLPAIVRELVALGAPVAQG